ncbi:acyltransferase [Roseiconus nitratireducens]|uniref:Acyltransferase n=2 Tax=Roseiconus nitratireducens TaxID=2605748 RepID=A0A5M6CVR6_9BACT|nr:acyltransferase [Roseiconus nitratireducens]
MLGAGIRYLYLKRLARHVGDNVMLNTGVHVKHWEGLELGSNITVQQNCYLDAEGGITIGDEVSIAHQSSILSFEHTWDDPELPIKSNPRRTAPVVIGDDVWIGCGVRILSGAVIGRRTVVAAGAVVRRGEIGGAIYGGVPAKRLADFKQAESPKPLIAS